MYYSTEDLKIEVLQPKKLIIYNLKFEKDSMHFGILSRDYLNTALSGENIWTSKYEIKIQLWGKTVGIPM